CSWCTVAFALCGRASEASEVSVWGVNLGNTWKVRGQPPAWADGWTTVPVEVKTPWGPPLNTVKLAVGNAPETAEREPNSSPAEAQTITIPGAINGYINSDKKAGPTDEDYFRFRARKGQRLIVEVAAAGLGSPLDSVVEVLDTQGHEVP